MVDVLEKIELRGYFKVSKVLDSKTFKKYFACGWMDVYSSSGENTTSGNEGESFPRSLGGKVQDPFLNLLPSGSSSSSDSELESLSDSGLSPELRFDGDNLGPGALMMSSATVARQILNGVILPADKEKVDQFTIDELVIKSFHALGQVLHHHPNLGIDLASMEIDVDLAEEEAKASEKEEDNKGKANHNP
ncbi:hypothetical protein Acr_00g0028190 [Actinidia rufa]|uniref:Uncharacterized protein n=1 Tax=Actinidia rufa TaxID=165716 RepID=A0A7J0DE71_9ERIC|nr:hypothetical protein Acr_00g0028190 [Actinidia rufa]